MKYGGKNFEEKILRSHRFGYLTHYYFKQNWMNGSQSNIIQYTILELMATIVSFEWGILKNTCLLICTLGQNQNWNWKKIRSQWKSKNASVIFLSKKKKINVTLFSSFRFVVSCPIVQYSRIIAIANKIILCLWRLRTSLFLSSKQSQVGNDSYIPPCGQLDKLVFLASRHFKLYSRDATFFL